MSETSNTGENRRAGTFTKGDPRINRKGRPESFDALRIMARAIANEKADKAAKKIGDPVKPEYKKMTVAERLLRSWAFSSDRQLQQGFIEVAFGKTPEKVDVGGEVKKTITIKYV